MYMYMYAWAMDWTVDACSWVLVHEAQEEGDQRSGTVLECSLTLEKKGLSSPNN